jgi:4-diphosphocytidyl-2-C-methyl-D-erythritol kinase
MNSPIVGARELAPAKINLWLHVGRVQGDGYHPVHSLMAFFDDGDGVRLEASSAMGFEVVGPFSQSLSGAEDNLVLKARDAFLSQAGDGFASFTLILEKTLPIASGLGGGSSDAAATLRLLQRASGYRLSSETLFVLARRLGADVSACLLCQPTVASGRGDVLGDAPAFPDLPVVLVNSGVISPTGPVYGAYDLAPSSQGADAPACPGRFESVRSVADFLRQCRNDLQDPAVRLAPDIASVLRDLEEQPETLLARMSGSGATCFALCDDAEAAQVLARRLARSRPDWWVVAGRLRGGEGKGRT